jgi:hypothetical protein
LSAASYERLNRLVHFAPACSASIQQIETIGTAVKRLTYRHFGPGVIFRDKSRFRENQKISDHYDRKQRKLFYDCTKPPRHPATMTCIVASNPPQQELLPVDGKRVSFIHRALFAADLAQTVGDGPAVTFVERTI